MPVHIGGLWSPWCLSGPLGSALQSCLPDGHLYMGLILLRCIFFAFSFVRLPEVSVSQFQQVWCLSVAVLPSNAPTMPSMNTFHGVVWKLAECKTCPDIQVIVYFSHFLITSLFSSGYLVVFSDTIKIDQSDPKFSFNRTAILLPLTFKALPFLSGKRPMNILSLDFFWYLLNSAFVVSLALAGMELFFS